ncbi:MAG: porin [Roseovarius sp.]|nr:porin [Roseovarius sp.]
MGGTVGVAGFTVGATYAENDNDMVGPGDQEGWSLGASYDLKGPWTVGLSTYQGEAGRSALPLTTSTRPTCSARAAASVPA